MTGKDLQWLRNKLGKTQEEFALMIRYAKSTIGSLEGGTRKITPQFIEYLELKFPKFMKELHGKRNRKNRNKI